MQKHGKPAIASERIEKGASPTKLDRATEPPECAGSPGAKPTHATAPGRNGLIEYVHTLDRVDSADLNENQPLDSLWSFLDYCGDGTTPHEDQQDDHNTCDFDLRDLFGASDRVKCGEDGDADAAAIDRVLLELEQEEIKSVGRSWTQGRADVSPSSAASAVFQKLQAIATPTPGLGAAAVSSAPPMPIPLMPLIPPMPLIPFPSEENNQSSEGTFSRALITPPNIPATQASHSQQHEERQMQRQREMWQQQQLRLECIQGRGSPAGQQQRPSVSVAISVSVCKPCEPFDTKVKCIGKNPGKRAGKRSRAKRWTDEETECLANGVALFGVGQWLKIKKRFSQELHDRSNVDLKDRWRNVGGGRQSQKRRKHENVACVPLLLPAC
jgi:hypothetical protein